MKKILILGSLLAVYMLVMLPSVSAVEKNIYEETKKTEINKKIKEITSDYFNKWVPGSLFKLFLIIIVLFINVPFIIIMILEDMLTPPPGPRSNTQKNII